MTFTVSLAARFVRLFQRITQTGRSGEQAQNRMGVGGSHLPPEPPMYMCAARAARPGKSRDWVNPPALPGTVASIPAAPYMLSGGVSIVVT
jgi:hypothetical protein